MRARENHTRPTLARLLRCWILFFFPGPAALLALLTYRLTRLLTRPPRARHVPQDGSEQHEPVY